MKTTITDAALALSGAIELSILGKATVVLAIGLAAAWVARRARASRRHLLLAATFAALLALPLVALSGPELTIELPAAPAQGSVAAPRPQSPQTGTLADQAGDSVGDPPLWTTRSSMPSWPTVARTVWLAGAAFLLLALALDLWRLRRLRRNGLPLLAVGSLTRSLATERGVGRSIEVLEHEGIAAPLTCGALRPAILLPSDARATGDAELRRAIVHELEHVRRHDWVVQLVARAACACYWFHPLVWVAWRRLCLEAERAADDAVVQDAERTEYAEQLVTLARRMSSANAQQALGMAKRSDLSARVTSLLDAGQRRGRAGTAAAAAVVCVASLVVIAIGPVRAVAKPVAAILTFAQEPDAHDESERETPTSPLDQALYDAAGTGDVSAIARSLDAGANVNCAIDGDGSPLIAAAREGHLDAVRLLLDRGADPNMPVRGDGSPLIMAARDGHASVVALLLDRGAIVDLAVPDDENALIQASAEGHLDVVKLLVARGADVNTRIRVESAMERPGGEWRSPLSMAERGRHTAVVTYLRSVGARE